MLARAVKCFQAQTYEYKRLIVWDTSDSIPDYKTEYKPAAVYHCHPPALSTIGALRNACIQSLRMLTDEPMIIIHWDDDDWSHPNRIAEQVALLQSSGKEAVGYREMLFWRKHVLGAGVEYSTTKAPRSLGSLVTYEAWLYTNGNPRYALGTSLCYWRSVWERRPFEDRNEGEDDAWRVGVDCLGDPSFWDADLGPRMIASIHGGNTSQAYQYLDAVQAQGGEWKRVPQWDEHCRKVMAL